MIQEFDVGIPLQIIKDQNTEVVDLKIVDKTFSKLQSQSNKSKFKFELTISRQILKFWPYTPMLKTVDLTKRARKN